MAFCIPRHLLNDFKAKLKSGEITPEKLMEMSSAERRTLFGETLGDNNAQKVNALFESKLILKSQKKGIVTWAEKVLGMRPEAKRDLVSRANRLGEVLTPESENAFLQDLASQRLGVNVTMKEAANIAQLAKEVTVNRTKIKPDSPIGGADRMEYGRARVEFEDYVTGLKEEATAIKLYEYAKPQHYLKGVENVFGFLKSMKATFDMSALGRQGLKTMFTQPKIWLKRSAQSFVDVAKTFKGENVMKEVRADIVSRPNSLNGLYKAEKLAVGVMEEPFPSTLPEKLPVLGRAFKASETAFTGFIHRLRADTFDVLVKAAKNNDADITGIGKLVNSVTGRGSLGPLEPAGNVINVGFFSARFARSSLDGLTGFQLNKGMGKFARIEGAKNTLKIIGGIGTILAVADAISPDSVEWDPRSTDFGKIKVGNTRFDVSGGMSSLVILAARLMTGETKSSTTGIITKLNDKGRFMARKKTDVLGSFIQGKFSPGIGAIRMMLDNETYYGDPLTPGNVAYELLVPIMITNINELAKDPNAANIILASMADFLGIGTNTWGPEVEWHNKTTKEMIQFKKEFGEKVFLQANKDYNELYVGWLNRARKDPKYTSLSEEDKLKLVQKQRLKFKRDIFIKYNFHPKSEKAKDLPRIK